MGMSAEESEIRETLKTIKAVRERCSGGHEIWTLPNGALYVIKGVGRNAGDWRAWKNALADLRRKLRPPEPQVTNEPKSERETQIMDQHPDDHMAATFLPETRKRVLIEKESRIRIASFQVAWLIRSAGCDNSVAPVPDDATLRVDEHGYLIISWATMSEQADPPFDEDDKDDKVDKVDAQPTREPGRLAAG